MKNSNPSEKNPVPIRHMNFNFDASKAAKYCWDNNSWSSAFILTFSAVIPAGERLVIDAVREFRDKTADPELKARVTGLIGQEATHSKVHEKFNNMYDLKGLPVNELARLSEKVLLELFSKRTPKKTRLAIACGIEHFTAVMAEDIFNGNSDRMDNLDGVTRDFMVWHLIEELEHKSVAFDLYEEMDGSYLHRIAAFILIWSVCVPLGLYGVQQFLNTPGFSQGRKNNREGIKTQFSFFRSYAPTLLSYFRTDFHPDNIDTTDALEHWRGVLFGKKGKLTKFVTKTITVKKKQPLSAVRMAG